MKRRMNGSLLAFTASILFPLSVAAQQGAAVSEEPAPSPNTEEVQEGAVVQAEATTVSLPKSTADLEAKASSRGGEFSSVLARPGGLTADEAANQAAEYSLDARAAREDYKYAQAKKRETVYNYLPKLTLTGSYTRQSVPAIYKNNNMGSLVGTTADPGPLGPTDQTYALDGSAFNFSPLHNSWYLNAGLVVPLSDYALNFSSALRGADAATQAAQLNEQAAQLSAAANARLAYYEWVRARLRVREANKSLERSRAQLENLRRLASAGRAARADVLRQEAFVSGTELEVRRAETGELLAQQRLHGLMTGGEEEMPEWEVGEDVISPRSGDDKPLGSLKALEKEAIEKRLEVQATEQSAAALDDQSAVYRSRGYPRVEAFGNLTYANPNARYIPPQNKWNWSWDFGVRAVWTVNDLGVSQSSARASDADAAKVRAQRRQVVDALRSEVIGAYRMVEEARLAKESARRGVLAAEAEHRDRKQLFEAGRSTSLDVLQAETSLVNARMSLIDAHIAVREAQVRLEHAVGRDVKNVPGRK